MTPATFDIEVPRNGDYLQTWQLCDGLGVPLDITGTILVSQARDVGNSSTLLASATITIVTAATGKIQVRWHGNDFDGYGSQFFTTRAAYDVRQTFSDGVALIVARGQIVLPPKVTV